MTLHTDPGCSLPSTDSSVLQITGTTLSSNPSCAVVETSNAGCSIRDRSSTSFGAPFNAAGGGAFAMRWASDGITVWSFPRGSVPADLDARNPQPDGWGTPSARFPASSCDPSKYFSAQSIVLNTALW